jgi:DNA repair protein SbcD/Mre11
MTSFRFIHAADLHLGSPFQGLALKDADVAKLFVEASRKAFTNLVDRALELEVDFVIIAGDVYDGDWPDNSIGLFYNRQVARLTRAGIPVYFLRGNHDAESVITKTITLPENVFEFSTRKPETYRIDGLKVALHGQGFANRSANDNLAIAYPSAEAGVFNIGVLHTSLTGREPHAPYAPCSLDDLKSKGYDYWALGHVHEYEVVAEDPPVIFPGNIQGRSIREQGARGAVLVTVEDGVVRHERLIVDEARFAAAAVEVMPDDTMPALLLKIEQAVAPVAAAMEGRPAALRLRLFGHSHLKHDIAAAGPDFRDEVQAACHRAGADLWLEKLELAIELPQEETGRDHFDGLDLEGLIDGHVFSPEMLALAQARIGEIAVKMPPGSTAGDQPLGADARTLLEEARELLIASARRGD